MCGRIGMSKSDWREPRSQQNVHGFDKPLYLRHIYPCPARKKYADKSTTPSRGDRERLTQHEEEDG